MNNFYHKLNLDYDIQELVDIANRYDSEFKDGFTDSKGNYITYASVGKVMGGVYDVRSMYLKDLPEDFRNLEIFKIAQQLFKNIAPHNDIEHLYNYAQYFKINGPLIPHKDKRTAVFTIPVRGVDCPVYWYNDNDAVLAKYVYDGPSIINTELKHGCMENVGERLFFQIGGFTQPFSKILEIIE